MSVLVLEGTIRTDVEVRFTADGKAVAGWRMPVDEPSGFTKWVEFTAWDETAAQAGRVLRKGMRVKVEAERIEAKHNETKDGKKFTDIQVTVGRIIVSKGGGGGAIVYEDGTPIEGEAGGEAREGGAREKAAAGS